MRVHLFDQSPCIRVMESSLYFPRDRLLVPARLSDQRRLRPRCRDSLLLILAAVSIVVTTAEIWQQASAALSDESKQASEANVDKKPETNRDTVPVAADQTKQLAYHGRVVDEQGNPIAGAELWYVLPTRLASPSGEILGSGSIRKVAATDSDGNFSFSVDPPNWSGPPYALRVLRLTAKAPGYGCDWMPLAAFETNPTASDERDDDRSKTDKVLGEGRFASRTLKLPSEAGPVHGRLVDLEGRPLADVEVCVQSIQNVNMDSLKRAFETSSPELADQARRAFPLPSYLSTLDWQILFPPPKTDQNGEFTLRGLGRNQVATVTLHHERVDAESMYIVGTEMEPQGLARSSRRGMGRKEAYLGLKFDHAVGPAIPVSGVVTESPSGKPIANARVYVERLFGREQASSGQLRFAPHIRTITDDQGRYKLIGIPPGKGHVLHVTPETTEPLFQLDQEFAMDPADTNVTLNLQVTRGLWIEGKVTDAQTGEPISGSVDYAPLRTNSNVSSMSRIGGSGELYRFRVDESGHYRVPGLTGPGAVLITASNRRTYPRAAGADKIDGYDPKTGRLPSLMMGMPLSNWNQVSFVDPPASATSYEHDVTLSAGLLLSGHVVGPDGSPASGVQAFGLVPGDHFFKKMNDDKFTVTDYSSDHPRDLFFAAMNGSLVGYLHLDGKPPEELTVKLQPAVTVRGRLVDNATNEPAVKFRLMCESSKRGEFRIDRVETDDQGRFELNGLLAGNVYKMDAANPESFVSRKNGFQIDLTNANPGDMIELGDVTGKNAKKEQ